MTDEPHVTVIIPTRERADVLEKSLLSCTSQNYGNLTVLVSDNVSEDNTREVVLSAKDPRVKYINPGKRLSMSHNYEFALSHVEDGWVTIIGDDDGILPHSLEQVAEIIASTDTQAIRSDVCLYRWPGALDSEAGDLTVPLRRGIEVRRSKEWLSRVLKGSDLYFNLPMLYSGGFVRASVLHDIKAQHGQFYHSCIPDVYSAFAIASVIDSYVWSYTPLAIDGVSKHSTGTSLINRARDRSSAEKFFSEQNIPWHPDTPTDAEGRVPRVHQAWIYESYLQSRFLRSEPDQSAPEEQLIIVLMSAGHDRAALTWARLFAEHHGLNFDRAEAFARKRRLGRRLAAASFRLRRALNTYYANPKGGMPLTDVYQASLAAGKILAHSSPRMHGVASLGQKALEKAIWH